MRALSACLTAVLGLGLAAMAACSSTASDTGSGGSGGTDTGGTGGTSSAGTAGKTSAGGSTVGAAGDTGAAGAASCPLIDGDCATCIPSHCGTEETACQKESACDAALEGGTDNFISCVCVDGKSIATCAATLGAVDATAKAVTDCAKTNCATACGL